MRLHENEIASDVGLVLRLLAQQFPQYAHLAVTELAASGSTNKLFRLGDELSLIHI